MIKRRCPLICAGHLASCDDGDIITGTRKRRGRTTYRVGWKTDRTKEPRALAQTCKEIQQSEGDPCSQRKDTNLLSLSAVSNEYVTEWILDFWPSSVRRSMLAGWTLCRDPDNGTPREHKAEPLPRHERRRQMKLKSSHNAAIVYT